MPAVVQIKVNTLRRNSANKRDIAILQALLAHLGLVGWDIDGVFGPVTERAVKAFQSKQRLVVDGIVGPVTWGKLTEIVDASKQWPAPALSHMTLQPEDYKDAAVALDVDVATIKAVRDVETNGYGFLPSGRPKILFEGHIFWSQLLNERMTPNDFIPENRDILYPRWTTEHYLGGGGEYTRLERAMEIHECAALKSTSWGLFQIMGFNYEVCGFDSVHSFIAAMYESERQHLMAFCSFVLNSSHDGTSLVRYLMGKNWSGFARGYNGNGYAEHRYDLRLAEAYRRHSAA